MNIPDPTLCHKHYKQSCTSNGITPGPCKACDKLQALADLRALCPPGTTVYTILRSVSRSGMSRSISPIVLDPVDGKPLNLTWLVSKALGRGIRHAFQDGVKCDGAGMDMGYDLVHSLSYALHGTDKDAPIFTSQAMHLTCDRDNLRPGYTLNHRWL